VRFCFVCCWMWWISDAKEEREGGREGEREE